MSDPQAVLEVLKDLVVLRRALRAGLSGGEGRPRLSVAQAQALLQVGQEGPMTMGELADKLGVSQPAATELVNRLVEAGRLERASRAEDRRKVVIQLTPQAQEIAAGALAERRAAVASVLDQLSAFERRSFLRGLRLLAETLAGSASALVFDAAPVAQEAWSALSLVAG
ncbi:MAG: MarR family transcriptional regulator [Chloroflexi bacterium]|nr:MarR family transcriptional regulator [Chloroflexota bacterium]